MAAGPEVDLSATLDPVAALGPVSPTSTVDEVTDRLATVIALGAYLPGDRLPAERELARLLAVGRGSVREAIARLRGDGRVETRRGRGGGAYVLEPPEGAPGGPAPGGPAPGGPVHRTLERRLPTLERVFDLRERVEEMVARVAAERRTPHDVLAVRAALAAFADAGSPAEEHAGDTALHDAVAAATGNPEMLALRRELLARATLGFPVEPYRRTVFARALAEHRDLVDAVVAGDAERAGRVARAHFAMSAEAVREVLARAGG